MVKMRNSIMAVLLVAVAVSTDAQVRGTGRAQGVVNDKETGKPVAGATVTVSLASEKTQPIVTRTNSSGHWSALGLVSGQWNVDISAPGYATSRGVVEVSEVRQMPMIHTELAPEVKAEPVVAPSPIIPNEAVQAIAEGQDLLKIKAGDVVTSGKSTGETSTSVSHTVTAGEVKQNLATAIADFEKALPMIPSDKPEAKTIRDQLMQVMAQAYYRAGAIDKAIGMLEQSVAADQENSSTQLLLANLYLENGQLDAGKALLEKLPPTAISDPTAYVNLGILFLNKKQPGDAATYFGKAIAMSPNEGGAYYYRGIAEVQLKQTAAARADFEKAIALSPESQEAKDAKEMLQGLPKK